MNTVYKVVLYLGLLGCVFGDAVAGGSLATIHDEKEGLNIQVTSLGFTTPASGFYPVEVEIENHGLPRNFEVQTKNEGVLTRQSLYLKEGERGSLLSLHPVVVFESCPGFLGWNGFQVEIFVNGKCREDLRRQVSYQTNSRTINTWWIGGLDGASLDAVANGLASSSETLQKAGESDLVTKTKEVVKEVAPK